MQVEFISEDKRQEVEREVLTERYKTAKTTKETRGYHSFETIPGKNTELNIRQTFYKVIILRSQIF